MKISQIITKDEIYNNIDDYGMDCHYFEEHDRLHKIKIRYGEIDKFKNNEGMYTFTVIKEHEHQTDIRRIEIYPSVIHKIIYVEDYEN